MSGAVTEAVLESIHDLSVVIDQEAFVGDRRSDDIAAQAFEGVPLMGLAPGADMEGESPEASAGVIRGRVGRDGAKRQGFAPGVGTR